MQAQGGFGSTREYVEGEGYGGKRQEKIKIIKKRDMNAERNLKDKATVKYNHADFIAQADNLTD